MQGSPSASGRMLVLGAAAALIVAGCAAPPRPRCTPEELIERRDRYIETVAEENAIDADILVERAHREAKFAAAGLTSQPACLDILVLSGGGDYGAFAAGFLVGWGEVTDPDWKRPHFDVVTGVSTGALIAPFAFVGTNEAYDRVFRLYREPQDDWVLLRGLFFFLPQNESLASIDGLRRDLEREVDRELLVNLAAGRADGRLCQISATNLDFGMRRVWELGREAEIVLADADQPKAVRRVHDRMLASAAVPAAFPPVVIDDNLYVDGCVTSNILYNANMRSPTSLVRLWSERWPGEPMPKVRVWVIINNQLLQIPQVTERSWLGITAASTSAMVRSATITALEHLATELTLLGLVEGVDTEFFVAAIPDYWRPPTTGIFQRETMESLAELGMKMGRQPDSWRRGSLIPVPSNSAPRLIVPAESEESSNRVE